VRVGLTVASVTLCVHAQKEKQLELSTPKLARQHALTLRSEGESHAVIKCSTGMGLHVCMTAEVSRRYSW